MLDTLLTFNIYLFYGLVFFTIGCVIAFRNLRLSQLAIASALPALAAFGFIHAFHEWSELYIQLMAPHTPMLWWSEMKILRVLKLWFSFLAMAWFAWKMLVITGLARKPWALASLAVAQAVFVLHLVASFPLMELDAFLKLAAQLTRWIFGLGASAVAGLAMIYYARQQYQERQLAGHYFGYCGLALIAYGLAAGLLSSQAGLWVPALRTLCAFAILVTLYQALKIFDKEREAQIEAQQRQLFRGEKMRAMGELASGIAHEIKTPLSYATLGCDLLDKQLPNEGPHQRQIARIRKGLDRATHISQEVLHFARQSEQPDRVFPLEPVIQSALELMGHRLKGFTVHRSLAPNLQVSGDPVKLEEVLINLISNAIDASGDQKRLEIHTEAAGERIRIQVRDYGSGVPEAKQAEILRPFFTTKDNGTGLGLAISQQIVQQHQGELSLHNWLHGLCVTIHLPRSLA
ncbi:sensor histidine kinase [Ferrimonas balearica]|uniref:sensor histidine kinase n=1 Tax=Ferrimonas balearica TaxID=44012 RepID=UPI001C990927|nr:HAMP domain-containing sensor histidine kinase [Ferrimonas balearica]MBY5992445.1 HAMP domain-containing histidine kinase [Ferrimonas balearica]